MARDCIFCAIVAGEAPSETVYADDHAVAFLDINPVVPGHTLVVPRRHMRDLFELREDEAGAFMAAIARVAALLRERLEAEGLNLFQANGEIAFQTVFHLHMHVLPRQPADGLQLTLGRAPAAADELARVASLVRGVE